MRTPSTKAARYVIRRASSKPVIRDLATLKDSKVLSEFCEALDLDSCLAEADLEAQSATFVEALNGAAVVTLPEKKTSPA